jgi:hypothetical protein
MVNCRRLHPAGEKLRIRDARRAYLRFLTSGAARLSVQSGFALRDRTVPRGRLAHYEAMSKVVSIFTEYIRSTAALSA